MYGLTNISLYCSRSHSSSILVVCSLLCQLVHLSFFVVDILVYKGVSIWFLVIDVDEEAKIEECTADGFDYYKYIDCMPEMRNELIEGSYNETACLAWGS